MTKSIKEAVAMSSRIRSIFRGSTLTWLAAALLLSIMATPALSARFASPGSVNTKAIVKGAVKTKKIANGAVTSQKIKDGTIVNVDIAAGAAIAASKINTSGLNADTLDGKDSADFVAKTGDQTMAGKLTASSFGYSAPKTSYLSIGAVDFVPENSSNTYAGLASGTLYATPVGGGAQYFLAPVHLPHGALVKSIRFRINDSNAGTEFSAYMYRRYLNGILDTMAYVGSSESLGEQSLPGSSIFYGQIDNSNYDYFLWIQLNGTAGGSISIRQVVITYETTGP